MLWFAVVCEYSAMLPSVLLPVLSTQSMWSVQDWCVFVRVVFCIFSSFIESHFIVPKSCHVRQEGRLKELMAKKVSELKKEAVGKKIAEEKLVAADDAADVKKALAYHILEVECEGSQKLQGISGTRRDLQLVLGCAVGGISMVVGGYRRFSGQCKEFKGFLLSVPHARACFAFVSASSAAQMLSCCPKEHCW